MTVRLKDLITTPSHLSWIKRIQARGGRPWVGVDLDGTLSLVTESSDRPQHKINEPIFDMLENVHRWIAEDWLKVKIFTARVSIPGQSIKVAKWLEETCSLPPLEITNIKDDQCVLIIDDIARQAGFNTGVIIHV